MLLPEQIKELAQLKRWVCHKDKVPKNPVTGSNAMANEESTWGTYEQALAGMKKFNFTGIGLQFGLPLDGDHELENERVTGIDLDHVIREDGTIEPFASEVITLMNSYTEVSPSGTGIHILCKAKMPNIGRKKYVYIPSNTNKFIIEIYNHSHYFTITGNFYQQPQPIASRTLELKTLYEKFFVEHKPESQAPQQKGTNSSTPKNKTATTSNPQCDVFSSEHLSDNELLERIFNSRNGYDIRTLFSGNTSSYASHSEADFALVSHLAYWTNGDASRIDALFRQSGLMRDKWNEKHGAQTYGEITISKALSTFSPYISSFTLKTNSHTQSNSNENPTLSETSQAAQSSDNTNSTGIIHDGSTISSRNIHSYIHGLFDHWQLNSDLSRFRSFADRKTGFPNIDRHVNFYPGLYVLGAISSLGKTTFIHQLADQLVRAGEHVLFFSLEQTCLELVTKGISRLMASKNIDTAVSAIDIRRGVENERVIKATEEYASFTEHEIILECSFATKIGDIINTVEKYIQETSVLPVVIIDYLQVICPSDPRQQTKDAVDTHVRALKKLQKDHDLVVILVSSLNRQNYLTPIDYESFKESGGIEYTADVIWGLQLSVINDDIFDKDAKLKAKREKIKAAKRATPRDIEFVCLKNRYGESNYTCNFKYYAQFDYFVPAEAPRDDFGYNARL
ncbi:MAG: hypothetical protein IJ587_09795 [Synergistaceae bacterium]|nr:hypothetical protein [Synergistaceae bacterium]